TVQSQLRMERARPETPAIPVTQPAAAPVYVDRRLLTPADVEVMRRKELKPGDRGVALRFEGDVKKRFADSQNMAFPDFNMLPPLEQALRIFDRGDDYMREHVKVVSDPESLLFFRRQIQPLVIQNCATTGCHGPAAGGGFMLITTGDSPA